MYTLCVQGELAAETSHGDEASNTNAGERALLEASVKCLWLEEEGKCGDALDEDEGRRKGEYNTHFLIQLGEVVHCSLANAVDVGEVVPSFVPLQATFLLGIPTESKLSCFGGDLFLVQVSMLKK